MGKGANVQKANPTKTCQRELVAVRLTANTLSAAPWDQPLVWRCKRRGHSGKAAIDRIQSIQREKLTLQRLRGRISNHNLKSNWQQKPGTAPVQLVDLRPGGSSNLLLNESPTAFFLNIFLGFPEVRPTSSEKYSCATNGGREVLL